MFPSHLCQLTILVSLTTKGTLDRQVKRCHLDKGSQGKSSQGVVVAICVVDPQGIFHTCTLGAAVGRVSVEGPVVAVASAVYRTIEGPLLSQIFFFTVRLFASYHARNACNYSAQSLTKLKPISFIPVTESNQTLILVLKMC